MKGRITALIERMDPRTLTMLMACVIAVLLLEGWLLGLKKPLSELRRLEAERATLVRPQADPVRVQADIDRLQAGLAALALRLHGQGPQLSVDQLAVHIIERLDRIALRHGIRLDSVRPGATRRVLMFDEVSSDIKLSGKYGALYEWLREAEQELGPMVVTRFSIKAVDGATGALAMELRLAAYRPAAADAPKP